MSRRMIVEWALNFALLAVGFGLVLCAWRLLRGPEATDRVLALDTMYINLVALVDAAGHALRHRAATSRRRC